MLELTAAVTLVQGAQLAAEVQSSSAVQASAEAEQHLAAANNDLQLALEQALDAKAERDQALQAALQANQAAAEAGIQVKLADKERDAALASLASKATDLDRSEEARLIAEQQQERVEVMLAADQHKLAIFKADLAAAETGRSILKADLAAAEEGRSIAEAGLAAAQQGKSEAQADLNAAQQASAQQISSLQKALNHSQQQLQDAVAERDALVSKGKQLVQQHIAAVAEVAERHAQALCVEQARLIQAQEALASATDKASAAVTEGVVLGAEVASLKQQVEAAQAAGHRATMLAQEHAQELAGQLETMIVDRQAAEELAEAAAQVRAKLQLCNALV